MGALLSTRRTERQLWPGSASTTAIAATMDEDRTTLEMDQSAAIDTHAKETVFQHFFSWWITQIVMHSDQRQPLHERPE